MRLRILGVMQHRSGQEWQHLTAPKWRALIASLLLRPAPVSVAQLIDDLWGDHPPRSADNQVHGYVARVRRALGDREGRFLTSRAPGYALLLEEADLDARLFERLTAEGIATLRAGDPRAAASVLAEGLALWRGPALADVPPSVLVQTEADRLEELRFQALEARIDADLQLGRHADVVPELRTLTSEQPLREHLWHQLMTGLYRSGRPADALDAYRQVYRELGDMLGIEPGAPLRELHQRILTQDAALDPPTPAPVEPTAPSRTVPRQLPPAVPDFVGREPELLLLDALAAESSRATTTLTAVLAGTAGVGKTAAAVRWAQGAAGHFPDGQLYVDLRGFDGSGAPVSPAEAVRGFLDALGVTPDRLPPEPAAQAGLYRSLMADRRMLVLLDNAADVDQVRPLLPGGAGCLVLVTSRTLLTGLVADGARLVPLELLSESQARELLERRLGSDRLAAEPEAAAGIIRHCARLPLALTIVAARATIHPTLALSTLAAELADSRHRLDSFELDGEVGDVRAVLSWSYRGLPAPVQRLFRLLALAPGPSVTEAAAASLSGLPRPEAARLLGRLARAHLITGHPGGRYRFHDLLRTYAAELGRTVDGAEERRAALGRLLDHHLLAAAAASRRLDPHRGGPSVCPREPDVTVDPLPEELDVLSWFGDEHTSLLAAIDRASAEGLDTHAWQLAWAVSDYLDRQGHWHDWVTSQMAGLDAAERAGDRLGQAHCARNLARARARQGRYAEADALLRRALEQFGELGDRAGEADTHYSLGWVRGRQERYAEALLHAQTSLELYAADGATARQARALNTVGWYHALLGEHEQTLAECRQALPLLEDLDDVAGQAATWDTLGYAHHQLGDHDAAGECYETSLRLYRSEGGRLDQAEVLTHLGDTREARQDTAGAAAAWREALAILEELQHREADAVRVRLAALASSAPPG